MPAPATRYKTVPLDRYSIGWTADGAPVTQVGEDPYTKAKFLGQEIILDTGLAEPDVYKCVKMAPTTWVKLSA